ncbi:endonuclease/exonuclease/phosphatase family protein [Longimycelium tulufanense]|nr:endonuclease/exonuclease/phosphatase family protein [Longimycelium tulufanense]
MTRGTRQLEQRAHPDVGGSAPAKPRRRRRFDLPLVVLAVAVAALLLGHRLVPDIAGIGTVLDSFLPWLGLAVPVLVLLALLARSGRGAVAVLLPALVWAVMFGPDLLPAKGGPYDLRVATQNLYAGNPQAARTATELAATKSDLIAVEEMTDNNRTAVAQVLDPQYPYRAAIGTIGLWSRYPILDSRPVDLGLSWTRALRARVDTPNGEIAVYVAHLGSLRLGQSEQRDRSLNRLAAAVRQDDARRLLVVGDLNTASTDRHMSVLTDLLSDGQRAGSGLGFTWPSSFPATRIDHILYRGVTAVDAGVVRTTGSDHAAATVDFRTR